MFFVSHSPANKLCLLLKKVDSEKGSEKKLMHNLIPGDEQECTLAKRELESLASNDCCDFDLLPVCADFILIQRDDNKTSGL